MVHPIYDKKTVTDFLSNILKELANKGLDVSALHLDHICYRVATTEAYKLTKELLLSKEHCLSTKQINGREIVCFELSTPIVFEGRTIEVLELPAPKASSPYTEGFEHVEFVLNESFDEFIVKHPSIEFDTKGIDKPHNAEIKVHLPSGNVKFHQHSLAYTIKNLD